MHAEIARLTGQGLFTDEEIGTTCCFATQDKVWVTGPAGEKWEVYTVLADSETFGTSPRAPRPRGSKAGSVAVGREPRPGLATVSPPRPAARGSALPRPWFYGRGGRIIEGMDVEVRFVEGCPNLPVTRQRLALALDAAGSADIDVQLRLVRTDAEATELGFTGSPTILIDGCDAFPDRHAVVGLSCRLYRTTEGASGSPTVEQLTTALAGADRG